MKTINTYIIEKLKINKDTKIVNSSISLLNEYEHKYSKGDFDGLKKIYNIAQEKANEVNKPIGVVEIKGLPGVFGWFEWDDDKFVVGGKNSKGNQILLKVLPE